MTIKGFRERQLSPHRMEVLLETRVSGTGMGTTKTWAGTGVTFDCLIEQLSASDPVVLAQPATLATYMVRAPSLPPIDPTKNRVRIVVPAGHAGEVLRVEGQPADHLFRGWALDFLARKHSEDQQVPVTLMAPKKKKAGKKK
jgi:hypothetical protein